MVASAHMSIVTAKVAGVERVAACTPPLDGRVPDATVAAMHLAGADEIYVLGGVQALAALALGTETIDPVDFLVGPGNAYVVEAKRRLFGKVGHRPRRRPDGDPRRRRRDGRPGDRRRRPARPGRARPGLAGGARDDVAGARRGDAAPDRRAARDACRPPRSRRGRGRTTARSSSSTRTTRRSPPPTRTRFEHVEIQTADPRWYLERMRNYGALFLGEATTVAYGDKTIGTNHILPTGGAARYTGGLWVGKFLKTVTFQECDDAASAMIGEICARQCRIENFEGHARSCDVRVEKYRDAAVLAGETA